MSRREVYLLDMKLKGPLISMGPDTHIDGWWQVYFDTSETIV